VNLTTDVWMPSRSLQIQLMEKTGPQKLCNIPQR